MSKLDIRLQFECQNRISNGKMRYSAPIQTIKSDFKRRNAIFGANSKVKIRISYVKTGLRMSKCDIQPEFEWQNEISNVRMRYSSRIRMSK